ncbi:MAG: hypothetical protein ACRERD_33310 [Candidatus Binatia bacterium]
MTDSQVFSPASRQNRDDFSLHRLAGHDRFPLYRVISFIPNAFIGNEISSALL